MTHICPICKKIFNNDDIKICPNCSWDFTDTDTLNPYLEQKKKQHIDNYYKIVSIAKRLNDTEANINSIISLNHDSQNSIDKLNREIATLENDIKSKQPKKGEELIEETLFKDLSSYKDKLERIEKTYNELKKKMITIEEYEKTKAQAVTCLNEIRNDNYHREAIYDALKKKFGEGKLQQIIRFLIK
jgi:chromosome segregation ATPase